MIANQPPPLLEIKDLRLYYRSGQGVVRAVDGADLTVNRGEAVVVLGESGCGKSSLAKALLRLLPRNVDRLNGSIRLDGEELLPGNEDTFRRKLRWNRISMVMQAAMNSLNPVVRVGQQVAEPLRLHRKYSPAAAMEKAEETFRRVGIPVDFLTRYPFELSGGMRQRAALAMALVTDPDIVVLDEPTSALDVLTQANIMNVLKKIKQEQDISFILITHDVSTSSEIADQVALMYAGQMVECGSAKSFFPHPRHPYSHALMASVPRLRRKEHPTYIPGEPPPLINPPAGCRFADRCDYRFEKCAEPPPYFDMGEGERVRCWLAQLAEPSAKRG